MQIFSILDDNGYVLYAQPAEECPENGTPLLVTTQMRRPRLVEGVIIDDDPYTAEEIRAENEPRLQKRVIDAYSNLVIKALRSSMGKGEEYVTYDQLKAQEDEYRQKYNVANGTITDRPDIVDSIEAEQVRRFPTTTLDAILTSIGVTPTGTDYEKMCALIIAKFEYGDAIYKHLFLFATNFRLYALDAIEDADWELCENRCAIVEALPFDLTTAIVDAAFIELTA